MNLIIDESESGELQIVDIISYEKERDYDADNDHNDINIVRRYYNETNLHKILASTIMHISALGENHDSEECSFLFTWIILFNNVISKNC